MTDQPLVGLLLGLVIESRHWTRIRWQFDDPACERAWQLSVIGLLLTAVLLWLDGDRHQTMHNTLAWLPALLMPVQFVQSFGFRDALPMKIFSMVAKRRSARNLRLGLVDEMPSFNFGYALVASTLVSSAVGSGSNTWMFLPGVVILSGWMLMWLGRCKLTLLVPLLLMTGLLALGGRIGLEYLYDRFGHGGGDGGNRFDPNFANTMIGRPGSVMQSPDIVWRVGIKEKSPPPKLLKTATYNNFLGISWRNRRDSTDDFVELDTAIVEGETYRIAQDVSLFGRPGSHASFTLRGTAIAESPLPLPGNTMGLSRFELDGVERNAFGTIRVYPKHPVIDGTVLWRKQGNTDGPPRPRDDLQVPNAEKRNLREILTNLGISQDTPLREQVGLMQEFFLREFRYTRTPTIRQSFYLPGKPTAISRFLTEEKAGHCEYFATAAVLMLRQNGIPARYTTGYALVEPDKDRGSFVIRGTHGHAWCRVWDASAGVWRDFDPTPPDWAASLSPTMSRFQRFNDWLQKVREDFYLWRNRPENRTAATSVILGVALLAALIMARRLWRSRLKIEAADQTVGFTGSTTRTALHALDKPARRILGERPAGKPFAAWLSQLSVAPPIDEKLAEAIAIHQRLRFDPAPAPADDLARLATLADELQDAITDFPLSTHQHTVGN